MAVKIIDNCCSSKYLDYLKYIAISSGNWNLWWPQAFEVEDRFLKLDIITDGGMVKHPFLAGLAMGLLIQIYEAGGQGLFIPEIVACGISIKDKHRKDNLHTDHEKDEGLVKVLGIINSDWEEKWGGGFFHNGMSNYVKPTSFCIFDSTKSHVAEDIFTDKKRFAIDFGVCRDSETLNKKMNTGAWE